MKRVEEFQYRKLFGLSKEQMAQEPLEDVGINFRIAYLFKKREERQNAIVEEKTKRGI